MDVVMTRPAWLLSFLTAIFWCGGGSHGLAQPAGDAPAAMVLVTTYADGRTTHAVVTSKPGHSWTPYFPRVPKGRTAADELPVTGVSYRYRLAERGVVSVEIAVFRGCTSSGAIASLRLRGDRRSSLAIEEPRVRAA